MKGNLDFAYSVWPRGIQISLSVPKTLATMLTQNCCARQSNSRAKGACLVMIRCPVASVVSLLQHLPPAFHGSRRSAFPHRFTLHTFANHHQRIR